jgi:hypothetical protein
MTGTNPSARCPIVGAMIGWLQSESVLSSWVFDGEVPRYDPNGNPINPASTITPMSNWPAIRLWELEPGFKYDFNLQDSYTAEGQILIEVFTVGRAACEPLMGTIFAALELEDNWYQITLQMQAIAGSDNDFSFEKAMLVQDWCGQDKFPANRSPTGEIMYRGDMYYDVMIHGIIDTGATGQSGSRNG